MKYYYTFFNSKNGREISDSLDCQDSWGGQNYYVEYSQNQTTLWIPIPGVKREELRVFLEEGKMLHVEIKKNDEKNIWTAFLPQMFKKSKNNDEILWQVTIEFTKEYSTVNAKYDNGILCLVLIPVQKHSVEATWD